MIEPCVRPERNSDVAFGTGFIINKYCHRSKQNLIIQFSLQQARPKKIKPSEHEFQKTSSKYSSHDQVTLSATKVLYIN
jgi:hypothetical protein